MSAIQPVTIRQLSVEDAGVLSTMLAESSPDYVAHFTPFTFDENTVAKAIAVPGDFFIGVFVADRMAGYCMLRGMGQGYPEPMLGLFVREEMGGKGVGRLLLEHAAVSARVSGIERIRLKVSNQNPGARRLYESLGYRFLKDLDDSIMMEQVV